MTRTLRFASRRGLTIALIVTIAVSLSSCRASSSDLARIYDGTAEFLVCNGKDVRSIRVAAFDSSRATSDSEDIIWEVSSLGTPIGDGAVIVLGEIPTGFREVVPYVESSIGASDDFITFSITATRGNIYSAQYKISDFAGLSEDQWLDSEGWATSDPCR